VQDDADLGPYTALRANPLAAYNDDILPQQICNALLTKLTGDNENAHWCNVFGAPNHSLSLKDVRTIVRADGRTNPWYNDSVIWAFLNILRGSERRKELASNGTYRPIHIHHEYTMVSLYQAYRAGNLMDAAMTRSQETMHLNAMSKADVSLMMVNLYSDHWYWLVIYPREHVIHCLNWLPTSDNSIKLLCRLVHVYLFAQSTCDADFQFRADEWSFCVIDPSRCPQQDNGNDCGAFACRAAERIVAGCPLDFAQATMPNFRYKQLLALKLCKNHRLESPGVALIPAVVINEINGIVDLAEDARMDIDPQHLPVDEQESAARKDAKAVANEDNLENAPEYY